MIQENIQNYKDLLNKVENHCMCLLLTESNFHYLVQYPDGYFPEGVRVEKTSKVKALKTLLIKMEEHLQDSFFYKSENDKKLALDEFIKENKL